MSVRLQALSEEGNFTASRYVFLKFIARAARIYFGFKDVELIRPDSGGLLSFVPRRGLEWALSDATA